MVTAPKTAKLYAGLIIGSNPNRKALGVGKWLVNRNTSYAVFGCFGWVFVVDVCKWVEDLGEGEWMLLIVGSVGLF